MLCKCTKFQPDSSQVCKLKQFSRAQKEEKKAKKNMSVCLLNTYVRNGLSDFLQIQKVVSLRRQNLHSKFGTDQIKDHGVMNARIPTLVFKLIYSHNLPVSWSPRYTTKHLDNDETESSKSAARFTNNAFTENNNQCYVSFHTYKEDQFEETGFQCVKWRSKGTATQMIT